MIWSFSGLYFPAFNLRTEKYGVSLRIQSEYARIWTRKTLSRSLMLILILTFFDKEPVKDSSFSKFANWFNHLFLYRISELKWFNDYICSKINSFAEKFLLINNLKASLQVHINHLLILQTFEPKLKPYFLKDLLRKIYTN